MRVQTGGFNLLQVQNSSFSCGKLQSSNWPWFTKPIVPSLTIFQFATAGAPTTKVKRWTGSSESSLDHLCTKYCFILSVTALVSGSDLIFPVRCLSYYALYDF